MHVIVSGPYGPHAVVCEENAPTEDEGDTVYQLMTRVRAFDRDTSDRIEARTFIDPNEQHVVPVRRCPECGTGYAGGYAGMRCTNGACTRPIVDECE